MLPWSRGLRKEFLPLFDTGVDRELVLKPVAHLVVETLIGAGVNDMTLVVRPRDRATVANYFSIDGSLLRRNGRHPERLRDTRALYDQLRRLRLRYAEQARPQGFGHAVLQAESHVGNRPFLLHASDAILDESRRGELPAAMADLLQWEELDGVLLVRPVADPRRYGVVEGQPAGRFRKWRRLAVRGIEEKPSAPRSRWAATAIYALRPSIFPALRAIQRRRPDADELELTWGIQEVLDRGGRFAALVLTPPAHWRSVGSPEGYYRALRATRAERLGRAT